MFRVDDFDFTQIKDYNIARLSSVGMSIRIQFFLSVKDPVRLVD